MLATLLALILAVNPMALPPTSVIVAGPQAGADRFDFIPFGQNNAYGSGKPAIYLNGADQYVVLYEISNFGSAPANLVYKLAVFKNGVQQDSANKPTIRNWDAGATCLNCASGFDVVQVGTKLYIFYFTDGVTGTDSLLSFKTFDMATDSWSAANSSTLTTRTIAQAGDPYNQFSAEVPYFVVVYDSATQFFYIVAQNGLKATIAGHDYVRPAFARFLGASLTWDATWTNLGDNTTAVPMGAFSACLDCRGAVNAFIAGYDIVSDPVFNLTNLYFQSIYPDQSVSALQNTGISVPTNAPVNETDSRILCTGTEFIVLYGTVPAGVNNAWTQLNCLRATVPVTNTLPLAWTSQVVRPAGRQLTAYIPFFIGGELYAVDAQHSGFGGFLGASHYNGATWDNDVTLAPAITLALADGTGTQGGDALITYDLSAPATDAADAFGSFQRLYGLLGATAETNYSAPVCAVPLTLACPVTNTGAIGAPYSGFLIGAGGTGTLTYSIISGLLPPGFALDAATGEIHGITNVGGTFTYTAEVTDSNANTATATCTITIPVVPPGDGGRKPIVLTPNPFDFCLHREYRLFCNIDYNLKGCARLPACFQVDEREWGDQG